MCVKMRTRKVTAARLVSTSAAVLVLSGCAMKSDVRDLQIEIRALAARQDSLLAELSADTRSTQDTLRTQSDQLFEFRGDINQSLRQIAQSLTRLEALSGENQRAIAGMRDQLANIRRSPSAPPPMVLVDSVGAATGAGEIIAGTSGNADQTWAAAMRQYDRRSFRAASAAFQQFLEEHPEDRRAPQAHVYLADILEQQERPEDALEAFQRIPTLYPTFSEMPNVLYRTARIQKDLGRTDEARATLERIINTYPDASIMVMLAREMLEEIG